MNPAPFLTPPFDARIRMNAVSGIGSSVIAKPMSTRLRTSMGAPNLLATPALRNAFAPVSSLAASLRDAGLRPGHLDDPSRGERPDHPPRVMRNSAHDPYPGHVPPGGGPVLIVGLRGVSASPATPVLED
jgi:hypothetical protein